MKISLMETLNNKGSKIEPQGTPLIILFHKLYKELISTLYLREA